MKILFGGDFYPDKRFIESVKKIPVDNALLQIVSQHNLFVVNLEAPITLSRKSIKKIGPVLSGTPQAGPECKLLGINVFSMANNHIFDMGITGINDTVQFCKENGIACFGAAENQQEANRPYLYFDEETKKRFAFIALAEGEFSAATHSSAGASATNAIDDFYLINRAKQENDIVIVIYHGGHEYYPLPSPKLQKKCKFFVDAGADAVICHHSHVLSGYEIYNTKPIFYSLGNFFFNLPEKVSQDWHTGVLLSIDFKNSEITFEFYPIEHSLPNTSIKVLALDDKEKILRYINQKSNIVNNLELFSKSWGEFCEEQERQYLSLAFGLNKAERFLLKLGFTPFWKVNQQRSLDMLGILGCEAHYETLEFILRERLRK